MDGHAVSENYGVRTGNDWYIHREVGYINTRWDDKIYAVTLSDSLYARDIPEVLVSDKVYARYLADKQETESILNGTKEERERNSKIRELTESIERAQAELKSAQEKLAALK